MTEQSHPNGGNETRKRAAPTGPVSPKTRAKIRKLAREGMSQTKVAAECGVSRKKVRDICAAARPPILFDRSIMQAAVSAHQIDMKSVRMGLSEKAIVEVERLFTLFTAQHEVINWHEGIMSTGVTSGPTSGDMKNYATSIGILIDKHLILVRHDSDDRDLNAVDAWITHIRGGSGPVETPEGWA